MTLSLALLFLTIDIIADIVNLALSLLDRRVKLHGLLGGVLQVLLKVGDLARELALGGTILCILLLNLGQVLELDGLTLEDAALHVLDQLLLLLAEQLVLQLHSMDLLFHCNNFCLSNSWVQSILHLFLKLILALPEKNLLFGLDYLDQNVRLLLLQLSDLVLELDGFVLHLLQLLFELHLNVEVIVCESLLTLVVLVNQVIELVHLEDLVFLSDFKLSNVFVVQLNLTIDPDFLLVKNGFLCAQIIVLAVNSALLFSTLDVLNLTSDPIFLDVGGFIIDFLDLLLNVIAHVLGGPDELVTVATSLKVGTFTVQTIDM